MARQRGLDFCVCSTSFRVVTCRLGTHIEPSASLGKTIKNDYVATELERLFESVGGNYDTINLRVLWQDMLITRDHKIVQHVLATGFQEFEKGSSVKLKCVLVSYLLITARGSSFDINEDCTLYSEMESSIRMGSNGRNIVH